MMINIALVENKIISTGKKKDIEKRKCQIKKPKSLNDFKTFLKSEFKTDNPNFIKIYSIDWDGEANEIKDNEDFQDEDNIAFRAVYDEENAKEENEEEENKDDSQSEKSEKEIINENNLNESNESINENELMSILDEELKVEKKDENQFDSKIFCEKLLNDFKNKQNDFSKKTKLEIDKNIENIMDEQSKTFIDLKNFPNIQQNMLETTKLFLDNSKINKKDLKKKKNKNTLVQIDEEKEKEEYDFKFLKDNITFNVPENKAKWIKIEDIQFQNIGKNTFGGGDLYFFKGEDSSQDYYFPTYKKDIKQDICLEDDLKPTEISQKFDINIRNEDIKEDKYIFYIYIKSDKMNIKVVNPLKIFINIIKDDLQERRERERKEREEKEKIEREELERKEREEKEEIQREEQIRKEREEKEKIEREMKERKEREEKEKREREEQIRKEREERQRLEREKQEKEEKEEQNNNGEQNNNEELVQKIYDELEDQYYISSFKSEEEIKEKIIEYNCDRNQINTWIESIM